MESGIPSIILALYKPAFTLGKSVVESIYDIGRCHVE